MNIQRLRNITTGKLHTRVDHIYADLEEITGQKGITNRTLPRVMVAVEPWLRKHVTDERFWNGEYDPHHTGKIDLPVPTESERDKMFEVYVSEGHKSA